MLVFKLRRWSAPGLSVRAPSALSVPSVLAPRFPFFRTAVAVLAWSVACTPLQAQAASDALTLDQAVQLAVQRSRLLVAAQAQTQATREQLAGASRLPDPVLKLGVNSLPVDGPDRFNLNSGFMTSRSVGLSQQWTRSDKRLARAARARSVVAAAEVGQLAALTATQRATAQAWLTVSFQVSMQRLVGAQAAQAGLKVQAAQTAYQAGTGALGDVFAARLAAEQLQDLRAQVDRDIAVARIQLARWVGDDAAPDLAERVPLRLPAWTRSTEGSALLQQLQAHPDISAAVQQEALAENDAALARAARTADWTVDLSYSQRGPAYSNLMSINLQIPLQWDRGNRQDRDLAARLAGVDAARARREDMQREEEAATRAQLQAWAAESERLQRFDTSWLPLAGQRSAAALAAYRAGTGTLGAVLEARRAELALRLDALRVELARARIWADLTYLLPKDGVQDHVKRTTP